MIINNIKNIYNQNLKTCRTNIYLVFIVIIPLCPAGLNLLLINVSLLINELLNKFGSIGA